MKKRKLFISLLSVACASCCTLALAACDLTVKDDDKHGGGVNGQGTIDSPYERPEVFEEVKLRYTTNAGGTYTITGMGDETKSDIVIPSQIGGIAVTEIGDYAFNGQNGIDKPIAITSVTIGESVTTIGEQAFSNCTEIQSIRIPNTVTYVGPSAFQNCTGLIGIAFGDSMTEISNGMFDGCEALRNVTIPDNVKSIGEEAFRSCTNLANIEMGKGVLSVGYRAFYGCTSLKKVEVGESVTTLGEAAFESCTSLESIVIPNSVRFMGIRLLANCQASLKTLSVPYIGAFRYNDAPDFLKPSEDPDAEENENTGSTPGSGNSSDAIDINDPTTYGHFGYFFGATSNYDTGDFTKNGLSNLTVIITDSSPITNGCFNMAWGVTTIIIKEGMTEIMRQGLAFMFEIETLVLPKSMKTIDEEAFYSSSTLSTVYYTGTQSDWSNIKIDQYLNFAIFDATKYYDGQWHYDSNGLPQIGA